MSKKRIYLIAMTGILSVGLLGCFEPEQELSADTSYLDLLITNEGEEEEENADSLKKGVMQRKKVNGEDFYIVINYKSGEEKWQINSNKKLYIEIKTENLPENLAVYIDNIHMDTSIVSTKAGFDGIMQDTMDDRVHNSLMLGFPIDNENSYFGINEIEGQNDTFIKGYFYGNRYYSGGTVQEKRYLESDYLEDGVWANRIDAVIDLIIVNKSSNKVLRQVSVDSTLLVEVNDKITFLQNGEYLTYDYDRDGSRQLIKRETKND